MLAAILLELAAFVVFATLSLRFHDREDQPLIRKDTYVDVAYYLLGLAIYGPFIRWLTHHVGAPLTARIVGAWPMAIQAAVLLFVYDGIQYALHRLYHEDWLWSFHAVHHSAEEIDILTTFRNHPGNQFVYIGVPTALLLFLGFSPAAFLAVIPINFLMGCLTHANLNWTYGPFRYVIASPMYHRWHHAVVEGSRSRNYAPNFPLWDLLFGTYYMPVDRKPAAYGAAGVPKSFVQQLAHPFQGRSITA
jgi:sterol desaturase/sphingolipid hydroxylase (fatty acid hydroxylase superfamily)